MTSHVCRCGSSSLTALPILLGPSRAPCHLMVTTLYMLFFWELSVTRQPQTPVSLRPGFPPAGGHGEPLPGVRGPRGPGHPKLVDAAALLPTPSTQPRVDFEKSRLKGHSKGLLKQQPKEAEAEVGRKPRPQPAVAMAPGCPVESQGSALNVASHVLPSEGLKTLLCLWGPSTHQAG